MSEHISGRAYVQRLLVGWDQFIVCKIVIVAGNASVMWVCVDEPIICFIKNGTVGIRVGGINVPFY